MSETIKINHLKDPDTAEKVYANFLKENNTIYLLAGELNPTFYKNLADKYSSLIKKITINIICGPYVAIENDSFSNYFNIHQNNLANWWFARPKTGWWKAHPIFEIAEAGKNINLFILKKRICPHFFVGQPTNDVLIEEPHEELLESDATVYLNDPKRSKKKIEEWYKIQSQFCSKWEESNSARLFKPIDVIEKEQAMAEKIKKQLAIA